MEEADSVALEAAWDVDEECLTAVLRVRNCDCRSTARDAVAGILIPLEGKEAEKKV